MRVAVREESVNCLVYASSRLNESGNLGPQAIERCSAALEFYLDGKVDSIFVTTTKKRDGVPINGLMISFFEKKGAAEENGLIKGKNLFSFFSFDRQDVMIENTESETDAFLLMIPKRRIKYATVSSWYHLPRIWLIWKLRRRKVKLFPAFGGVSLWDIVRELGAIGKVLLSAPNYLKDPDFGIKKLGL